MRRRTDGSAVTRDEAPRVNAARTPWRQRLVAFAQWGGLVVAVLLVLAAVLYRFGSMERPTEEVRTAYARLVAGGEAKRVEQRFTIPIPGCRCHSDDPVQQMQHSVLRIDECRNCH